MMLHILEQLIVYRIPKDHLIYKIATGIDQLKKAKTQPENQAYLYQCVKELLDKATQYGWNHNLWHCLLTYRLLHDQNSYTLSKERRKQTLNGSITTFLYHDMSLFMELFHYDFQKHADANLPFPCFAMLSDYQAVVKREEMYDGTMGNIIMEVAEQLQQAKTKEAMLQILDAFYETYGTGTFAFHKAYRVQERKGECFIEPISNLSETTLEDLIGYESQKAELRANTEAFLRGKHANNVLLYGESGTGKSTSIKAIANRYFDEGLRLIEIHKHQFHLLHEVIAQIKKRNYGFIIYMDDLSFEEDETEYKYLKAVIEGGLETRPANVLIYATSNRRHLIKETWRDRNDVAEEEDLHISETMSEKLSLVARFGISIYYGRPTPQEYHAIVNELAKREALTGWSEQDLWQAATAWELRHGGVSGRCAQQLIDDLIAKGK